MEKGIKEKFNTEDEPEFFDDPNWESLRASVIPPGWVVETLKETGEPVEWENPVYFDDGRVYYMYYRTEFDGDEIVTRLKPGSLQPNKRTAKGWLR